MKEQPTEGPINSNDSVEVKSTAILDQAVDEQTKDDSEVFNAEYDLGKAELREKRIAEGKQRLNELRNELSYQKTGKGENNYPQKQEEEFIDVGLTPFPELKNYFDTEFDLSKNEDVEKYKKELVQNYTTREAAVIDLQRMLDAAKQENNIYQITHLEALLKEQREVKDYLSKKFKEITNPPKKSTLDDILEKISVDLARAPSKRYPATEFVEPAPEVKPQKTSRFKGWIKSAQNIFKRK